MGELPPPRSQKGQDDPSRGAPCPRAPQQMGKQMVKNCAKASRAYRQRDQELLENSDEEKGAGEEEGRILFIVVVE